MQWRVVDLIPSFYSRQVCIITSVQFFINNGRKGIKIIEFLFGRQMDVLVTITLSPTSHSIAMQCTTDFCSLIKTHVLISVTLSPLSHSIGLVCGLLMPCNVRLTFAAWLKPQTSVRQKAAYDPAHERPRNPSRAFRGQQRSRVGSWCRRYRRQGPWPSLSASTGLQPRLITNRAST